MFLQQIFELCRNLVSSFRATPDDTKATEITSQRKANEILGRLQARDFATLRAHFWRPLQWFLSESLLQKGFEMVCLTAGSLEHAGTPRTSTGWLLTSVSVPMRFRRARLALCLTTTPGGSLVGLKFMPQSLAGLGNAWQPPAYAGRVVLEEEEVRLGNRKLKVTGTLALPKGVGGNPCVVMLAGSGPVDRDSTVEACKPFKDLAIGLAGQGIATLRFDKVTFTHGSRVRGSKTFTLADEYLEHALDAVRQCLSHDRIRNDGVFIMGHSLGGYVVPQLAVMEPRIAGGIMMATPTTPMYRAALKQLKYFATLDGASESVSEHEQVRELAQQCELADSADLNMSTPSSKLPFGIGPAYWINLREFSPVKTAAELPKPLLVLQGARDYQVTVDEDFAAWQAALAGQRQAELRLYESLNHLFIAGEEPSTPLDYITPGNVDEAVIRDIDRWVFDSVRCR